VTLGLEQALRKEGQKTDASQEVIAKCRARAKKMLADIKRVNPKQHALITDPAPYSAGICPRRAGKSYAGAAAALITGEAQPGAISIIISLNLKQLKRLYWSGAPSGLFTLARQYGLNLEWQHSMLRWEHENGSIGYLLGAEDEEQLEVIRGLEADLYLIDECKSFAPSRLQKLITEIITPQRATRQGRVILIGTPGNVLQGPFYEATCPDARDRDGKRLNVDYVKGAKGVGRTWSRHHWTLEDNKARPHQWDEALVTKAQAGGVLLRDVRHPGDGPPMLLLAVAVDTRVAAGLPEEGAPWRLIGGLDIGFEDKTAFVIAAYSSKLRELRHVYDFSKDHMIVDDVGDVIAEAIERFGNIEKIFADTGNLGKMVVATLQRRGLPIEAAEKREKFDHIELLNSAFARGEVKVIENTTLEEQLLADAWDLSKGTREELARQGRLREDDAIANDAADAFLYLYRGSLHQFGWNTPEAKPVPGTPEWVIQWERDQLALARRADPDQHRINTRQAPHGVIRALQRGQWLPTPGRFKKSF